MDVDKIGLSDGYSASIVRAASLGDRITKMMGVYEMWCVREGVEVWRDTFDNLVTDVGANYLLECGLAASALTTVGPFMGLISSVGYTSVGAANTMASHATWAEAGNGTNYPNWSTPASNARATCAAGWNAAGSRAKALSSARSFTIATNGGTVKGSFLVTGTGAVATNNDTNGTLLSCGTFSGGDKIVQIADVLNVSWSLTLGA